MSGRILLPDVIELQKGERKRERMKIHMHQLYTIEEWGEESGKANIV